MELSYLLVPKTFFGLVGCRMCPADPVGNCRMTLTYFREIIECHAVTFSFSFTPRLGIFTQSKLVWHGEKKNNLF